MGLYSITITIVVNLASVRLVFCGKLVKSTQRSVAVQKTQTTVYGNQGNSSELYTTQSTKIYHSQQSARVGRTNPITSLVH